MPHAHRTSAAAAAAVGTTVITLTVATVIIVIIVIAGDEVGAVLLAGGLLVAGHALRRHAREALIYRPVRARRPTGARFGEAGEVPREIHPEETS